MFFMMGINDSRKDFDFSQMVICDACGASLYIRDDDAAETVLKRLNTYHEITEPLKDYYAAKGILACVKGMEKVEDTTAGVMKALSKFEA